MNNEIMLSINSNSINKDALNNKDPSNLSRNFINYTVDIDGFYYAIAQEGYMCSAQVENGHRKADNFIQSNLVLVDIDSGLTIEEATQHEFYKEFASGYYTTPTHTIEAHRFRLVFVTARIINNAKDMTILYTVLIKMFGGDESCKDPCRLFFGCKDSQYDCIQNRFIDNETIDLLLAHGEKLCKTLNITSDVDYEPPNDLEKEYIINELCKLHVQDYYEWRNIAWSLKSGGFALSDLEYITTIICPPEKINAGRRKCKAIWAEGKGDISIGTVWFLIGGKKKYYDTRTSHSKIVEDNKKLFATILQSL